MKLYLHFDRRNAATDVFLINGVEATLDDFGAVDIEGDGEYGIKSARFVGELRGGLRQILDKYGISEYELNEIYDRLTDGLTWGQE